MSEGRQELRDCPWCGGRPYDVPQTCEYSYPGIVHRFRVLCPMCKTQTPECKTEELAVAAWQRGDAMVWISEARARLMEGEGK